MTSCVTHVSSLRTIICCPLHSICFHRLRSYYETVRLLTDHRNFSALYVLQFSSLNLGIRQTSAEPGSDGADLKIRGFGSALVVVDGIPGRNYSDIDPSEIESVSVLKDASAALIEGVALLAVVVCLLVFFL